MSPEIFLSSLFTYFQFLSPLASYLGSSLMSFSCGIFPPFFFFFFFFFMIDILFAIFIPSGVIGKSLETMVFIRFSVRLLFLDGLGYPTIIVMDSMVFGIDICKRLRAQAE